jgi:hypothetical protein
MKVVVSRQNQTVFDIALRELGDPMGVIDIMKANAFLRLDYCLPSGVKILIPEDKVINAGVVDYYLRNDIYPVTGDGIIAVIDPQYMVQIVQSVNYRLLAAKTFEGVRLHNLKGDLTIQINFTDLSDTVHFEVEQSLDGISYSAVANSNGSIDNPDTTATLNLHNLLTNYCRLKVSADGNDGTLTEIIWRV